MRVLWGLIDTHILGQFCLIAARLRRPLRWTLNPFNDD